MNDDKRFYFAAKAFIVHEGKFLIVQRSESERNPLFWELVGGRMEFGETVSANLKREIMEEVGLQNIEIIAPIGVWSFMLDENNQLVGSTFLCKSATNEIKLSFEHKNYAWIAKDELGKYNVFPGIIEEMNGWDWEYIENVCR
ncbi:MAG: NUDIX domain-containing protein [Defluviitaleaceae bacterium]|nr:NUDIX domain-containing protein [Defluviitaleaceae bacterium]